MKFTVATPTGYEAEISLVRSTDGETVIVKASTKIRGMRTPSIPLRTFEGPHVQHNVRRAADYATRVVAAIMDTTEDQVVPS